MASSLLLSSVCIDNYVNVNYKTKQILLFMVFSTFGMFVTKFYCICWKEALFKITCQRISWNNYMCTLIFFLPLQETQFPGTTVATRKTVSTSSAPGSKTAGPSVKVSRTHSESIVNGDKLSPWHVSQSGEKKVERKIALTTELWEQTTTAALWIFSFINRKFTEALWETVKCGIMGLL